MQKKNVAFRERGNETEIEFELIGKDFRKSLRDVKVILGKL